jgi:hypothetical protein
MTCNEDERDESEHEGAGWTRLSAMSFTRDWESEEDAVYDDPP